MNHIVIDGRLARDAEVKHYGEYTQTKMRIVWNKWNNKTKQEEPKFFSVKVWKELPLEKGQAVIVEGQLEEYTYDKDGTTNSFVYIDARKVTPIQFIKIGGQHSSAVGQSQSSSSGVSGSDSGDFEDDIPF